MTFHKSHSDHLDLELDLDLVYPGDLNLPQRPQRPPDVERPEPHGLAVVRGRAGEPDDGHHLPLLRHRRQQGRP